MVAVVVLAAGQGKRMVSKTPKVLHPVGGKPMLYHVIDTAACLSPIQTIAVVSSAVKEHLILEERNIDVVVQSSPKGTGDAVRVALDVLKKEDDVLILCGDVPLIEPELLHLLSQKRADHPQDILVVGMRVQNSLHYGRLVIDNEGCIEKIIEFQKATEEERQIDLCNAAVILAHSSVLRQLIPQLKSQLDIGEFYLTDIIELGRKQGIISRVIEGDASTLQGVNDRVQLAQAEAVIQNRWRQKLMLSGVTMVDPNSVFLHHDTIIGKDCILYPNVTFGPNVQIGSDVTIYQGCHITETSIDDGAKVGPFAHLRVGTILGKKAEVGNFVETKNTCFGEKAKAKHLSYLGDAEIGSWANIGAGTITCNYNGYIKSKTVVRDQAFVGSNTSLVAPVTVGRGAIIAAGSVIQEDVPDSGLAITRAEQVIKYEWAQKFRQKYGS